MGAERRNEILLAIVAVVLAFAIYRAWPTTASVSSEPSPTARAGAAAPFASAGGGPQAPEVHLGALEEGRPRPTSGDRNLFRFKVRPAPRPPAPIVAAPVQVPLLTAPPPPPPLPPIAFKFIGIVEAPEQPTKIEVLSDGRNVFHGREGDIIEGRYRILRIGVESIEMVYLDGRGRQTIRLSGS